MCDLRQHGPEFGCCFSENKMWGKYEIKMTESKKADGKTWIGFIWLRKKIDHRLW
jgi:hypothetical protein